jgi:hypothetical protein
VPAAGEINYSQVTSVAALRLISLIAAAVRALADPAAIFTYQRSKSAQPCDVPRATTRNGRREPLLAILKGRMRTRGTWMKDSPLSRRSLLHVPLAGFALAASGTGVSSTARAQTRAAPAGAYAHNVEAVGYTDLDHRPAFKMAIQEVNGRWFLYTGHFWHAGWSILDVTNPANQAL